MVLRSGERKSRIANAGAGARRLTGLQTAAAALFLLSACAAAPTYKPPDPGAAHAVVTSSIRHTLLGSTSMTLREVDGKTTRREERVAPGDHLVSFGYTSRIGTGWSEGINSCHVPFKAEADRRYRGEVDDRNRAALVCWLVDEKTGESIEGYFGSLEPTMRGAE